MRGSCFGAWHSGIAFGCHAISRDDAIVLHDNWNMEHEAKAILQVGLSRHSQTSYWHFTFPESLIMWPLKPWREVGCRWSWTLMRPSSLLGPCTIWTTTSRTQTKGSELFDPKHSTLLIPVFVHFSLEQYPCMQGQCSPEFLPFSPHIRVSKIEGQKLANQTSVVLMGKLGLGFTWCSILQAPTPCTGL